MKSDEIAKAVNRIKWIAVNCKGSQQLRERISREVLSIVKNQDRDTRHACAELVNQSKTASEAHNMCINCRDGLSPSITLEEV